MADKVGEVAVPVSITLFDGIEVVAGLQQV